MQAVFFKKKYLTQLPVSWESSSSKKIYLAASQLLRLFHSTSVPPSQWELVISSHGWRRPPVGRTWQDVLHESRNRTTHTVLTMLLAGVKIILLIHSHHPLWEDVYLQCQMITLTERVHRANWPSHWSSIQRGGYAQWFMPSWQTQQGLIRSLRKIYTPFFLTVLAGLLYLAGRIGGLRERI